jgi:hypothetical protein
MPPQAHINKKIARDDISFLTFINSEGVCCLIDPCPCSELAPGLGDAFEFHLFGLRASSGMKIGAVNGGRYLPELCPCGPRRRPGRLASRAEASPAMTIVPTPHNSCPLSGFLPENAAAQNAGGFHFV